MIKNYFKTAFRNLLRNKTYGFLNIFGLAIGIACAGLIFLWVEDEMTFDHFNAKKNQLYRVEVNMSYAGNHFTMASTPRPLAAALKSDIPGIVNTARFSDSKQRVLFGRGDNTVYASGRYADASFFNMFTIDFVQGNARDAFKELHSMVITQSAQKKIFGNEKDVIGKSVRVDNQQDFIVSGVIKDLPDNATLQFEWLAPYESSPHYEGSMNWDGYGPFTYVELDGKTSAAAINQKIKSIIHQKNSEQQSDIFLFAMQDWRLHDEFVNGKQTGGGRITQVYLFSSIAWILIIIACINFMNLATASSLKRAKEVGVRKVLGVSKRELVAQFMAEALLMSAFAAVVAVIIMVIALPGFNMLMQKQLVLDTGKPLHILALAAVTIICGLVAGSYPSLYLSSFNPVAVLKGLKLKTGSASLVRQGLVIVQFTVSVVFIISTVIIYLQIKHVKERNLGFNKDNLVEIDMRNDFSGVFPMIKQHLFQTGLVENAASSDHVTIYGGNSDDRFNWRGKPAGNETAICFRSVSPEFMATMGITVSEGRDFTSNTAYETNHVIITESMAKLMGNETAIGKIIQSPRGNKEGVFTDLTVVGVVKNYVFGNMYGEPAPVIFFCKPPKDDKLLYVRLKPHAHADEAIEKITAVMKKDNPGYPLEYKFVDEQFNNMFANEALISKASGVFAVLTIIVSCLGLFGLATYTAERRVKEIGIRKVLGAGIAGIAGLLSKDFLQLVFISCVIAFPVSWWIMHNWLQGYQYRINISWWIFLLAGAVAMLIALLTISYQAIKAAMANPVKSLRNE